jgi:hypothetical protein
MKTKWPFQNPESGIDLFFQFILAGKVYVKQEHDFVCTV